MKVAHVVKRIEMIDDDIKQLKKLETQLKKGKSYSTPIMISIEKQINIMLAERIKFLELRIENPPESMMQTDIEDDVRSAIKRPEPERPSRLKTRKKEASPDFTKKREEDTTLPLDKENSVQTDKAANDDFLGGSMLTQDMIDRKFDEARRKIFENLDEPKEEKKKGTGGLY